MAVVIRLRDPAALKVREGIPLTGMYDGSNISFTTPEPFIQTSGANIKVYLNGQRLRAANDYVVSESGGPGTGFDTVTVATPPKSYESLIADYRVP